MPVRSGVFKLPCAFRALFEPIFLRRPPLKLGQPWASYQQSCVGGTGPGAGAKHLARLARRQCPAARCAASCRRGLMAWLLRLTGPERHAAASAWRPLVRPTRLRRARRQAASGPGGRLSQGPGLDLAAAHVRRRLRPLRQLPEALSVEVTDPPVVLDWTPHVAGGVGHRRPFRPQELRRCWSPEQSRCCSGCPGRRP